VTWTVYQTQRTSNGTEEADMQLKVPYDYSDEGENKGVLMFRAR